MFYFCIILYFSLSYDLLCEVKFFVNNVEEWMIVICMSNIFFILMLKFYMIYLI